MYFACQRYNCNCVHRRTLLISIPEVGYAQTNAYRILSVRSSLIRAILRLARVCNASLLSAEAPARRHPQITIDYVANAHAFTKDHTGTLLYAADLTLPGRNIVGTSNLDRSPSSRILPALGHRVSRHGTQPSIRSLCIEKCDPD